jgi:hexosaminidase
MYDFNPLEDVPPHMQHLVIGGEVSLWSEQTDPVNLDVMLWPRTSAAAEILWSGPKAEDGGARNQSDITYRLAEMRNRLVAMGVRAEPVRMLWCERNGGCDAL